MNTASHHNVNYTSRYQATTYVPIVDYQYVKKCVHMERNIPKNAQYFAMLSPNYMSMILQGPAQYTSGTG